MMSERDKLLNEIEQFQAISGVSDTAFGAEALNDPNWIFRLRRGADPKMGTVDKVRRYMREWRPTKSPKSRAPARAVA